MALTGGVRTLVTGPFHSIPMLMPVLNRELIAALRTLRAFAGLLGYLLLFVVLFLFQYSYWNRHQFQFGIDRSVFSRGLFIEYSTIQIIAFGLISLLMASRQISTERQRRTFDLLLTTPLHLWHILVSKALASIGYVLLLAVATLPFYSICFMLGGVDWRELLVAVYLTLLTGVTYAVIGIASSASPRQRRSQAQGTGLFPLIMLNGGLALLAAMVMAFILKIPEHVVGVVAMGLWVVLSPVGTYVALTGQAIGIFGPGAPGWFTLGLLGAHTLVEIGVILLFIWLGVRQLRKEPTLAVPQPEPESAPKVKGAVDGDKRRWLTIPNLFPIPDWLNPVTAKDLALIFPRRRAARLALYLLLGGLFLFGAWGIIQMARFFTPADARRALDAVYLLATGTVTLLVALRASGVIPSERESGMIPDLTVTPLRPEQVVFGKLLAVLVSIVGGFVILGVALLLFYCLLFPSNAFHAVFYLPIVIAAMIASGAMYGAFSLLISAGAKSARSAGNRLMVIVFLLFFFVLPFMASLVMPVVGDLGPTGIGVFFGILAMIFFPVVLPLYHGLVFDLGMEPWLRMGERTFCLALYVGGILLSLAVARAFIGMAAVIYESRSVPEDHLAQQQANGLSQGF